MSDQIYDKVGSAMDLFKKILSKVPGFGGYIERQKRRDSDKLLRDTIAERFEQNWQRISTLQRDFISKGEIENVDDLEAAAIKLRAFTDRLRRAPRGYSGLFDAVKINEDELAQIYAYDAKMLDLSDEVGRAIDNVEASVGGDGLPAALRNLTSVAQSCVDVYNKRSEVVFSSPKS
jgi:hypothetical protein